MASDGSLAHVLDMGYTEGQSMFTEGRNSTIYRMCTGMLARRRVERGVEVVGARVQLRAAQVRLRTRV